MVIPLPYYFWENARVGVETLSYDKYLDLGDLPLDSIFEVRMYVLNRQRLHRVIQAAFDTTRNSDNV